MLRTDGVGRLLNLLSAKAMQVKTMSEVEVTGKWYTTPRHPKMHPRDFFAILRRGALGPFRLGKPYIRKFVIMHDYCKKKIAIILTAIKLKEK